MFEHENSTGTFAEVTGGEQETVVESRTGGAGAEEQTPTEENRSSDFDIVPGGQESAVGSQQKDGTGEDSGVGEDGGNVRQPDGAGQAGKEQSREVNAAIRAARLRAEAEAEARERARTDERIIKSGAINPYTNKPFASLEDFLEYAKKFRESAIEEEAARRGESVETVTEEMNDRDFIRNLRRSAEAQESALQTEQGDGEMDFLRRDVMDFVRRYPDVNVEQLEKNPHFLKFCGSRFKKEPLADLYEGFMEFKSGVETAAVEKSRSRAARTTGGGTTGGSGLSPAQQAALRQWNAENPDMPMTEKEFFARR